MGLASSWKTATIANGAAVSDEVNMGAAYQKVIIIMPNLTTDAGATIQVSDISGGTFVTLYGLYLTTPGAVNVPKSMASVVEINGVEYLKVKVITNQGAERKVYIRGV